MEVGWFWWVYLEYICRIEIGTGKCQYSQNLLLNGTRNDRNCGSARSSVITRTFLSASVFITGNE